MTNLHKARAFTIRFTDLFGILGDQVWDSRKMGVPNNENLARQVERFVETFRTGHNRHILERRSVMITRAVVTGPENQAFATWTGNCAILRSESDYEQSLTDSPDPQHLLDAGLESRSWSPRPWTCMDAILPLDYLDPRVDGEGVPFRSKGVPPAGNWLTWGELCDAGPELSGCFGLDLETTISLPAPELVSAPLPF